MLFEADGGTRYAHREYSSALRWLLTDRSVLRRHYAGVDYGPAGGERLLKLSILADTDFQ